MSFHLKVCLVPGVPRVPREDRRERGGDHPVRTREEQVQRRLEAESGRKYRDISHFYLTILLKTPRIAVKIIMIIL